MAYAPVPDTVLAATERVLTALLPMMQRPAGAVSDGEAFARYRARLARLMADTRAAARSDTLAADIAAVIEGYAAASADDPRAVIAGLGRLITATRGLTVITVTCATDAIQRANEDSLALLFECLAIAAQGAALATLTPRSSDEATRYRIDLAASLRLAAERAGDAGHAEPARALRSLAGAITRDMIERGRPLARIVAYETALPLPAGALAHLLYQDGGRRDELVGENDADHPAFMPMAGRAYSK